MKEKRIALDTKGEYKSLEAALDEVKQAAQGEFYGGIVHFGDCGMGTGCFMLLTQIPEEGIEAVALNALAEKYSSMNFGLVYDRINILKCNEFIAERDDRYFITEKARKESYACQFNVIVDAPQI